MTSSLILTNTMLNIVVDTNQFLSGFIYHGMMKTVFDLVLDKKLQLSVSSPLKAEVLKKLQEFNIGEMRLSDKPINFSTSELKSENIFGKTWFFSKFSSNSP